MIIGTIIFFACIWMPATALVIKYLRLKPLMAEDGDVSLSKLEMITLIIDIFILVPGFLIMRDAFEPFNDPGLGIAFMFNMIVAIIYVCRCLIFIVRKTGLSIKLLDIIDFLANIGAMILIIGFTYLFII